MAIWDRLVEVAAEQHGYVTTRDARDIGVDPVQLRLLAGRGRLERVGRGVYRVPVLPLIYAGALEGLDHLELARTVDAAAQAVQRFVARIDRATKR